MPYFEFTGASGHRTTVKAKDEESARSAAMVKRWGPPTGMYAPVYRGLGLILIEVRDEDA